MSAYNQKDLSETVKHWDITNQITFNGKISRQYKSIVITPEGRASKFKPKLILTACYVTNISLNGFIVFIKWGLFVAIGFMENKSVIAYILLIKIGT